MSVALPSGVGAAIVTFAACLAGEARAGSCTLMQQCEVTTICESEEMTLDWSTDTKDAITLNGKAVAARWLSESTVLDELTIGQSDFQIVAPGPMVTVSEDRLSILIFPSETPGNVILTATSIPRRYTEYEGSLNNRTVFHGLCEGLF
ncbi:hypothetical protein ACJ5NV_18735 [Loktanella agnita]|uniref:hypothetical protein n=1 Tax=Loktanella agnita TaxID=287097 RepID=UPI0039890AF6